jgi:hypothetical protein
VWIWGRVGSFLASITPWTKSWTSRNTAISGSSSHFLASNDVCQVAVTTNWCQQRSPMTYRRRHTIEKVSSTIHVEGPQIKPKTVFIKRQLGKGFNKIHFVRKSMAHLIRSACAPDNMWHVETFIWLRYKATQGILPIDRFVKPIKCLTSAWRDAGCMRTLRGRGPAGAVSRFACGSVFVVAVLLHWRTWCEMTTIRGGWVAIGWFRVPTTGQRAGRHERVWSKVNDHVESMSARKQFVPFRSLRVYTTCLGHPHSFT